MSKGGFMVESGSDASKSWLVGAMARDFGIPPAAAEELSAGRIVVVPEPPRTGFQERAVFWCFEPESEHYDLNDQLVRLTSRGTLETRDEARTRIFG
jgi:hypothetical protein